MADLKVSGETREQTGTSYCDNLRKDGKVPGIVYGGKKDNVMVALAETEAWKLSSLEGESVEVDLDGNVEKVVVKAIQWGPFGEEMLHLDFHRAS